ncbi:MAG: UvrD-helicase domain-containing protein [Proteobacteria bacterium]|nr:UvrD-helicase domain-containing protein [Pseudomonadota bacterium]
MKFIADLHIHSKYSRATAKNLDLEHLYVEARKKGITVIGTGDSTHPGWFSELKEKLTQAEDGLLRLRPDIENACNALVPGSCTGQVRFMLESEISSIYKKNDKTRKNHNLVFFPDFDSAERFNIKLDAIGNIRSDGRPILGLDARNLLEILLETHDQAFMIPAHIWTPWFSLLGSKSGFDTLEECFGDLTPEIFAVETGLSSDPPMNWRISFLDNLTLVSNSDAHSPSKLGREANMFSTDLSYHHIRKALKTGDPNQFLGTLEFFPEEGKYHHDGHRKCLVSMEPEESVRKKGICPVCGKPMTLGVNYRVLELADRKEGQKPTNHHPFHSIIPLNEVLGEIMGCGTQTKGVRIKLQHAVETLGPELEILQNISISDIKEAGIPLLGEAIERIRNNCLNIQPGYDGEFGKIKIFTEDEKEELMGQKMLFSFLEPQKDPAYFKAGSRKQKGVVPKSQVPDDPDNDASRNALNPLQENVVNHQGSHLMVIAGPGTGKTHTLIRKIGRLITDKNIPPEQILAITFTVKAAREMKERLLGLIKGPGPLPLAATFHSLGHTLLCEWYDSPFSIVNEEGRLRLMTDCLAQEFSGKAGIPAKTALDMIERAKQNILGPDSDTYDLSASFSCDPEIFQTIYRAYASRLKKENLWDYDDLVFETVRRLESDPVLSDQCRQRFPYVFVDEYQDLNHGQYRLVRALCPTEGQMTVIGDPDQSIYGFRGSDSAYFMRFQEDYPGADLISLNRNYRSTETILNGAFQMIEQGQAREDMPRTRIWSGRDGVKTITVLENPTEKAEGTAIGKCIEHLMGGVGFHSMDFSKEDLLADLDLGFSDFAILTRTGAQGQIIADALGKGGIPCQYVSRDSFWGIPALTDLLACLKILHNINCPDHEIRGLEPVHPGGSQAIHALIHSQETLKALGLKDQLQALTTLIPGLAHGFAPEKHQNFFEHLLSMAAPFGTDVGDFLKTLSLCSDQDLYDWNAEKVSIMTMHASKGLEFKVVFIAGCENGLIPFKTMGRTPTDPEEERRLFYVAMTRARDLLYLSFSKNRTHFGKPQNTELSPFVRDMDRRLLRFEVPSFSRLDQSKKPVQLSLF